MAITFTATGADANYVIPASGDYDVALHGGAGARGHRGGLTSGRIYLELGTIVTFKVGCSGGANNGPGGIGLGGWPDGGNGGLIYTRYSCGGGGGTYMFIGGSMIACAGGGGCTWQNYFDPRPWGGGEKGGDCTNVTGGTSYGGGTGAPATSNMTIGGNGGYMQGGTGSSGIAGMPGVTDVSGGGGGFYGGGGGADSGGGSGYVGSLVGTTTLAGSTGAKVVLTYVGPNPSGVMPGIPLTIKVRATTSSCYVEKDIVVRVLGYVEHATFAIPALVVGTPVSYQLPLKAGTGYAPIVWSAGGNIPTGLTVTPTGLLTGTPTSANTFVWTVVTVDDSAAVASTIVTSIVS